MQLNLRRYLLFGSLLILLTIGLLLLPANATPKAESRPSAPTQRTLTDQERHKKVTVRQTTTTTKPAPRTTSTTRNTAVFHQPKSTPQSMRKVQGEELKALILVCISSYEGGYGSVNPTGKYRGAYQFDAGTWRGAVSRAGYPEWAETPANEVPPKIQDAAAWQLYLERGLSPWPTPNRYCHPPAPIPKFAR